MSIWWALLLLFLAGGLGGFVNALMTEQGLRVPRFEDVPGGGRIWRPGMIGNVLIGGIGGVVLVALNTPLASVPVSSDTIPPGLTVGNLASAILVGIGGARLLTDAIDKRFDQATRSELASGLSKSLTAGAPDPIVGERHE